MNTLFGQLDRIAIERLKTFEPPEGYWVAYSGGKDSDVILDLVRRSGVKYDAHHSLTTADPPEVIYHVREQPDVKIHRPKMTMWALVRKKKMPPRRNARYCCETQKESGGSGRIVVTGIRRAEGANRSRRQMVESCYKDSSKRYLNVIIDWTTTDVWQYIRQRNIKYCSLYNEGFKRIGCVLCPMTRDIDRQMQRFPKLCRAWERAVKATFVPDKGKKAVLWECGDCGKTKTFPACPDCLSSTMKPIKYHTKYIFETAEEYWQWWLDRDRKMRTDKDEMLFRDYVKSL